MSATHTNFDQGEAMRLRESGGLSRIAERTAMDGRAGAKRRGRFEAARGNVQ